MIMNIPHSRAGHTRSVLKATSALVCFFMAALPVNAQSNNGEIASVIRTQKEQIRFANTVRYADLLELTYNQIKRDIQSWASDSGREATLAHMAINDVMPNNVFRRINTQELTDWGIRARLCDDLLIVYYKDNDFKQNITPSNIRVSQKERLHRNGSIVEATNKAPLGWIDQNQLVLESGERRAIPACMDDDYATPLPRSGVAYIGTAKANHLYDHDQEWPEFRREACIAPQVGAGRHMRRIRYLPVDGLGKQVAPETFGPWVLATNNCADPQVTEFLDGTSRCTRTIAGQTNEIATLWRWKMKQIQDPSDPTKTLWVIVDTDGSVTANPQGELVQNLCDVAPAPPVITTSIVEVIETRPLVCREVYPTPTFLAAIPYRDGEYIQQRTKSTFHQEYDFDRPAIDIVSYTAWEVETDTCSRRLAGIWATETRTLACPIGAQGQIYQQRQYRHWRVDYAKDATPDILDLPISETEYGEWAQSQNLCHVETLVNVTENRALGCPAGQSGAIQQSRVRTSVITYYTDPSEGARDGTVVTYTGWGTTSNSCQVVSTGGNGGGDTDTSVDTNGDGIGDSPEGTPGTSVHGGCGACNGPNVNTGSGGGEGGGGGGKIVCTAMNARYGFGTFRQAIWLEHARKHMTPFHQTGYHLMALPLIRYAYGREDLGARVVRAAMEHMARERTADIWAQKRGTKRRTLGRLYRNILEPLSYGLGRLAKGRTVAGIKDVPVLATLKTSEGFIA
jgi:hypothetical protein